MNIPRPRSGQYIRLVEFTEFDDLVARIFSVKGSSPITLRSNGVDVDDAEVGRKFREAVEYYIDREVTTPVVSVEKPDLDGYAGFAR